MYIVFSFASSGQYSIYVTLQVASSLQPHHVVSTRKNEFAFADEEEKVRLVKQLSTPVPIMIVHRNGVTESERNKYEHHCNGMFYTFPRVLLIMKNT